MNKIIKFVVLPLAGIFVIVARSGPILRQHSIPTSKPQILQAVKDKTQRTLKLDGDMKLSLFPSIGATLGKASLSERASDREFAGADNLHVALKLFPLLSKQVVVDAIEAENLRANLVRFKDGKTNMDDLTGGGETSASTAKGAESQVNIDIDHVTIKNATVTYADQESGAKYGCPN
jgi:AsmA protein